MRTSAAVSAPAWAQARPRLKLGDRQRTDVAYAAAIEITRTRMMQGMSASPGIICRERDHADDSANTIIRDWVAEK
jgi:hypothetical protein